MTPQLKNLLIILGAIVIVLIVVMLLFSSNSSFRRVITQFLDGEGQSPDSRTAQRRTGAPPPQKEEVQKSTSEPVVVMATLIQKSDDRLHIIESTGKERFEDEYYELVFVTRKGKKLRIECSAEAYGKVPFNQQGSLTYKRNMLVKFKYYEDTVFN